MCDTFCGIDFGTSNSTVGIPQGNSIVLCPLEDNLPTIPSAIFFSHEEHTTLFGRKAVGLYTQGVEGRLLRSLKSILGTSLIDETTEIQGRGMPLRDVISLFFGHLRSQAEKSIDAPLGNAVLGRPVRFVDDDDEADRRAHNALLQLAKEQGFAHVETQLEPVAAALAHEQGISREELALVVDLGGGTSDFAIVRLSPERSIKPDRSADILACTGVHIGGTDVDRDLSLDRVMPQLGLHTVLGPRELPMPTSYYHDLATWHRVTLLYQRRVQKELQDLLLQVSDKVQLERLLEIIIAKKGHLLAAEVEAAKIELSESDPVKILLPLNEQVEVSVSLSNLNAVVVPRAKAIVAAIRECCVQAGVTPEQIDTVFMTGGTSMIPEVRSRIVNFLSGVRVVDGDVFGSVGVGLGIDAVRRFGSH
ncbi:MAG: Hsp70 family protein [Granulosicoccus sp.]|nr:Hsp70 family protein [Granulosicoccus sp.]